MLSTSWEQDRLEAKLPQRLEEQRRAEALRQHLAEKRAQAEADNLRKKSGRLSK